MKARLPKGYGRPDPNAMMRQVQKMQDDIRAKQEELEAKEYTGTASGEMVTVTMNGKHEITAVKIKPEAVDPDDIEMLEDLIAAAVNSASAAVDKDSEEEMSKMTGGLNKRLPMFNNNVEPLENLIDQFAQFPGIGRKSAVRMAYQVMSMPPKQAMELAKAIEHAKSDLHRCRICQDYTTGDVCKICASQKRDRSIICVVEGPRDIKSIERTHEYNGLYHVLHGLISPMDGIGADQLCIKKLLARLNDTVKEVIMATSPTVEGEATAMYIAKLIKPLGIKTTRLAYGLPVGSSLEYADETTLYRAMAGRGEM